MSRPVAVADLFRVLLPREQPNGWLAMLTAYFDDSGTHGHSNIVLMAGVFGTEAEMRSLELLWQHVLDDPLDGRKPPVGRFHMAECQDSRGEFEGWKRVEVDYFCHKLQDAILESGVAAYGMCCSRQDWDDVVTGDMRAILGDAEGFAVRNCFVKAIEWAKANTFDPEMTFVFDDRPQKMRETKVVFDAFERHTPYPHLAGIAFLTSHKVRPLQAADMIAWELYQHGNDILVSGMRGPQRPQFLRLGAALGPGIRFVGQIALRGEIENIVKHWSERKTSEELREIADYFTSFDPDAQREKHA